MKILTENTFLNILYKRIIFLIYRCSSFVKLELLFMVADVALGCGEDVAENGS